MRWQYTAVNPVPSPPQKEWFFPPWLKEIIISIDSQVNYLDIIAFGLGACIILIALFIVLKRRKKQHSQIVSEVTQKYERDIQEIQKGHLEEIYKAEETILAFEKSLKHTEMVYESELKKQEEEYQKSLIQTQQKHSKRVQKIEKDHSEIYATSDQSIFELKKSINRLRSKQLSELKGFQEEVSQLKHEIATMHESHREKIEQSELQISDLRKQLRALMYKV